MFERRLPSRIENSHSPASSSPQVFSGVLLAGLLAAAAGCDAPPPPAATEPALEDQSAQYPRGVLEVTEGVHVAVGYGLGNSILLVGDGANVIIDTMESAEAARPVRDEFRRISEQPVAAIVYTHNHADHVFGAGVLAGDDEPEIYAHATFQKELDRILTVVTPVIYRRSMRQFGTLLPDGEHSGCGIGPRLVNDATTTPSLLVPTKTFDGERMEIEVAGLSMVLLHLPGETPDQIGVWLPDQRVLISGDNYYHSFPNLYAIRGTSIRDVRTWVDTLDTMRRLEPDFLVPGHTLPVSGRAEIHRRLTDYRDAIQFVHDQTVRAMNLGQGPDEIVQTVRLPEALASRPWLGEFYGRVDWSVRSIFDGYLGWFDGDAAQLSPLTARRRGEHMAALAGGPDRLRDRAREALEAGEVRWALELSSQLLALDQHGEEAARIRAAALRTLAASETSANGRNYYLTQALEAEGRLVVEDPDPSTTPMELLDEIPVSEFLRSMTVRLDPAKAEGKTLVVGFRFPDLDEEWGLHLRNSVVQLEPRLPAGADMTVTTDSRTWKEILTRRRNATMAFASGDVEVDRNRLELVRFLFLFR